MGHKLVISQLPDQDIEFIEPISYHNPYHVGHL